MEEGPCQLRFTMLCRHSVVSQGGLLAALKLLEGRRVQAVPGAALAAMNVIRELCRKSAGCRVRSTQICVQAVLSKLCC